MCHVEQSAQQILYNLYNRLQVIQLKGYTMMQFSWMLLRLYKKGRCINYNCCQLTVTSCFLHIHNKCFWYSVVRQVLSWGLHLTVFNPELVFLPQQISPPPASSFPFNVPYILWQSDSDIARRSLMSWRGRWG